MCLSLSMQELANVVNENLLVARVYVYALYIGLEKSALGEALKKLEHRFWSPKLFNEFEFKIGEQQFTSYYKSPKQHSDLYALIASKTCDSLRVETWRHPPGNPLPSNCSLSKIEVENVSEIKLEFKNSNLTGSFSSMCDHSKWAMSRKKAFNCIGDINRAESQFNRGGGTTCMIEVFFTDRDRLTSMFYNDQPPSRRVGSNYAHAKGLMIADAEQGFWLIHSIPRFISTTEKGYSYKTNGRRYGQVAMCLSLSVAELAKVVAKNLLVARPYVYSINIEDGNSDLGKALKVLKRHKYSKITQSYLKITTLGGEQFHSYYKSPNYRVDLYADIVAKSTQTSLRVESWRHPLSRSLKSECDSPRTEVENIEKISLSFGNTDLTGTFESSQDHSKWVVSRLEREDMVCVGDINRAPSQFHRGGGTTCMMNDNIWKKFNNLVSEIERCPDDQDPELKTKKSTALDFFKEKWDQLTNFVKKNYKKMKN
ncbi:deoxyribonuclease-2-like protein [Sarcoptes scabiei]|uniref:Deoxyribonuclease-2-like protein n=1 Tax=Sarcoptes scabiei TaxID=52283 RepID=A0A131ZYI6_SARSC|nr:deoxyribonuclease-2-like protein [Sarcoptes scabiei]